jgi:hypothetical protein
MELIVFPISLIGDLIVRVVEDSLAIHFVLFPFTLIFTTLFVVKSACPVSETVKFVPFVLSFLIGFIDEFHLRFFLNTNV